MPSPISVPIGVWLCDAGVGLGACVELNGTGVVGGGAEVKGTIVVSGWVVKGGRVVNGGIVVRSVSLGSVMLRLAGRPMPKNVESAAFSAS